MKLPHFLFHLFNMYAMPLWVLLISNVIIAAGTVYGGWGIIETMGVGITNLTRSSGFAANVGAVASIFGATQLGIPISTTHAAAASIAGAGYADKSPVRLKVAACATRTPQRTL
jgi:PiT family inorganic phosphate transporter